MAYDEKLASRVRAALAEHDPVEKKMFGGLCFMVRDHMCCGIVNDDLMLRIRPEDYEASLKKNGARPMDFTGRPSKGMIYVAADSLKTKKALDVWLAQAVEHVTALPKKKGKK